MIQETTGTIVWGRDDPTSLFIKISSGNSKNLKLKAKLEKHARNTSS
jgi:hypothetical protein